MQVSLRARGRVTSDPVEVKYRHAPQGTSNCVLYFPVESEYYPHPREGDLVFVENDP